MFYPQMGHAGAYPVGVHSTIFTFYVVQEPFWTLLKHTSRRAIFELLAMFQPPKAVARAYPLRDQLTVFQLHIWSRNRVGHF